MNDPLRTAEDYELFLYTLADDFPSIRHSTLTFVRRGASLVHLPISNITASPRQK
jgi:hypothetical protein